MLTGSITADTISFERGERRLGCRFYGYVAQVDAREKKKLRLVGVSER